MSASVRLLWREGVSASADGESTLVVTGRGLRVSLPQTPAAILNASRRLVPPGEDQDKLGEVVQQNGNGALTHWYYCVERLTRQGLLCHAVFADGLRLATLVAVSPSFVSGPSHLIAGQRYRLSRFAYLRRDDVHLAVESPLAQARIIVNDCRVAALVSALAAPVTTEELAQQVGNILSPGAGVQLVCLLLKAGLLTAENEPPALQTWEFHDLLFHARSRRGRFDAPYGGTCRFAHRLPPPPALKPVMTGEAHDLYRPDLAHLEENDPPFGRVQAQRRSIRDFDPARPISDRQLGEFLFRVARVTGCREGELMTVSGPLRLEAAARPYPAGGGLYELELYAAIQNCTNLALGLYYYDPLGHRLIRLRDRTPELERLLDDAAGSAGIQRDNLQVLLVLAARFGRVAWKYESIAYALILKHVGVVYQTMYLAATAMELAPCAIGGGDADLFARAAGTDYYTETSVGEFLLGNPRPEHAGRFS